MNKKIIIRNWDDFGTKAMKHTSKVYKLIYEENLIYINSEKIKEAVSILNILGGNFEYIYNDNEKNKIIGVFKKFKKYLNDKKPKIGDMYIYKSDDPFMDSQIVVVDIKCGYIKYKYTKGNGTEFSDRINSFRREYSKIS